MARLSFLIAIIFTALAGAIMYLPDVSEQIGWYNSSEFHIAALTLDVPHAPGYPLFTRLASLAAGYFPGASVAARINLLTALTGIMGAVLLTCLLLVAGCSGPTAALAGLLLLAVPEYRNQSIMAEVYALEICFILLGLLVGLLFERGRTGSLLALAAGLTGAMGVGHRPTFALYALTLFFFIRAARPAIKPAARFWVFLFIGVLAGLIPSFDLYFRLQNPARVLLDPMIGHGIEGFFKVFTGTVYGGGLFVFSLPEVLTRFLHFLSTVIREGGVWLLLGPVFFLLPGPARENRALKLALTSILLINLGFVLNYNAFEAQTMLLPSFMALAALAALAVDQISHYRLKAAACAAIGSTALFCFYMQPASVDSPAFYVKNAMKNLPDRAMLLMSNDVEFKPYWYFRLTEGFRKDLAIQLVDKIENNELQTLKPVIERQLLYGSLVYPKDSLMQLTASYSVEAAGYLHKIVPSGNWSVQDSQLVPSETLSIVSSGWPATSAANIHFPGEVFNYQYAVTTTNERFKNIAVVTLLVDGGGLTLGDHGILVGHDLHFPSEFFGRNGRPATGRFVATRSLVLPERLSPGKYRILLYAFTADNGWPEIWTDFLPHDVSIFNIDGFLEVFALRNGLTGRPLVKTLTISEILNEPSLKALGNDSVKLAEFEVQPHSPL
ncbi:MAG TPA: DUF2723 domain-containing protein [Candidatus Rifleibacterium sp.]|nr:DUF2723 domain-containing protein [Candidatus Rifleibacterium sp.]HPT45519.1 DUF2723 domain-containing protein [Candidatus Rifleibacterium sp.]